MRPVLATASIFSLILAEALAHGDPPQSVVYDSLLPRTGGGHGFVMGIYEMGQSITLGGSARTITQLDMHLQGFRGEEFRVRFYRLDAESGVPSTIIWESPTTPFDHGPSGFFNLTVPNIPVPDSIAYTVISLTPGAHLALAFSYGASIGRHDSYWYRQGDMRWRDRLASNGTFGARFFAIPEPSQPLTGLIAAIWASRRARPRRRKGGLASAHSCRQ
jgi:hypothetical protein